MAELKRQRGGKTGAHGKNFWRASARTLVSTKRGGKGRENADGSSREYKQTLSMTVIRFRGVAEEVVKCIVFVIQ